MALPHDPAEIVAAAPPSRGEGATVLGLPLLPFIVACALFIENMDSTVLATSLPAMAKEFGVAPVALKFALTAYLASLAVFIPVSGWVADRYGGRKTFVAAIGVFLIGSLACAAASSLPAMVAARFLQGLGGAMMVPVGRLVLLQNTPKSQLVQALSYLTIPALLGPVFGPPLGGFITTYFHWRWIFLINIPIALLGMALGWRFVPEHREVGVARLDWRGFLLCGIGLLAVLFGVSSLGRHLVSDATTAGALVGGLLLLVAFVMYARKAPRPLLDFSLLRYNSFRVGVIGGSCFRIGIGALPFLLPLLLQLGFGLSPFASGLTTFVSAVGAMFMKTAATRILHRYGFRRVLGVNALAAGASIALCALFTAQFPHALLMAILFLGGLLRSLQFTALNAITYAEVEGPDLSRATSFSSTVQQLAASLGIAFGSLVLELATYVIGDPLSTRPYGVAFLAVGALAASSAWWAWRLSPNAGDELSGRGKAV